MENAKAIKNLLDSYIQNRNKPAIFIKQDKLGDVSLTDMFESGEGDVCYRLVYEYDGSQMLEAYEPFLGWIKDLYYKFFADECTVEEFVNRGGVYSLLQDTVCSYIRDGKCRRVLDVMPEEYEYEAERMLQSLCSLFEYIASKKMLVIVVGKIHKAPCGVMQFVNSMLVRMRNIIFIFSYEEAYLVKEYCRPQWDTLMKTIEEKNMVLEISDVTSSRKMDYPQEFLFVDEEIEVYLEKLFNMVHMLAFRDAHYYVKIIHAYLSRENANISDKDMFMVLMALANTELGLGNYKNVLFACERMVPLVRKLNNLRAEYVYYYITAKAQLLLAELEQTFKFCKKCKALAKKLDDEKLLINVEVVETVAHYGTLKELFRCNYAHKVDDDVIKRLEKFNYQNFLAYVYIFSYDNDLEDLKEIAAGRKEPYYFEKGIEIATKLDNRNLLLMAYMKNVIMYSEHGYYEYVTKMYEKRLGILDKDKPVRIAHAYSGLGYNCIVMEEYAKADAYLRQGINILIETRQAEDMAETLYNMLVNYFVAGINDKVIECGELIFKILGFIGKQSIQICNASKMYGFITLACYKNGRYYDCYYYIKKMEEIMSYVMKKNDDENEKYWLSDLFLYHISKASMYIYEEKFDKSKEELVLAKKYMDKIEGDSYYTYMEYAYAISLYYDRIGKSDEKGKVLEEIYEFYTKGNFKGRAERVKSLIEDAFYGQNTDFAREALPVKAILDICELVGAKLELENRDKDTNFLALFNETISRDQGGVLEVIEDAVNMIQNTYNLDRAILLEKSGERCMMTYSHGAIKLNVKDMGVIFQFFDGYKAEFITHRIEHNYQMYSDAIEKFNMDEIATAIGVPVIKDGELKRVFIGIVDVHRSYTGNRTYLNKHNLTVVKYAVHQLSDAIKRIKSNCVIKAMNQELEKSSVTDQLTGIYNRMGLDKLIKQGLGEKGTLLYLDLDYFKKYNDTYGHDVGDLILKSFATILADNVKNIGYAIRYGGDEFVAIIPDKDEQFGKQLATNINKEFMDNYEVQVAIEGQLISSSIGVAEYDDSSKEGIEQGLKAADLALYEVKNQGRGTVICWSELE